ncbi:MAG: endonuclease III [Spirochaetia bacterium]|nr:endonuclease III [Spirochaetia bacterium]
MKKKTESVPLKRASKSKIVKAKARPDSKPNARKPNANVDWSAAIAPLIKKYSKLKHPLSFQNPYQLLVQVTLSAQSSDNLINSISPVLFEKYPDFATLRKAKPQDLFPYIKSVRNFAKKAKWLCDTANKLAPLDKIPLTMKELTELSGIGRKSASVILRELGGKAEGIIVDLHVMRVAPRLGIANGETPDQIEKELMAILPEKQWNHTGMCISFLGRLVCRPTDPLCDKCVMQPHCRYANKP